MVPRPHQPGAPLVLDHRPQPLDGRHRQAAQRVAVEVAEVRVVDHEPVDERGERIDGVEPLGHRALRHGSRMRCTRTRSSQRSNFQPTCGMRATSHEAEPLVEAQ